MGKRTYACYVEGLWDSHPTVSRNPVITPIQNLVAKELRLLGYDCSHGKDDLPYIPRGLDDGYGEGSEHVNWVLHIRW